ncbi:MAG TPA: hypothetical protein VEC36_00385 [Patescibacteria group bacterium]|nr:hypothetical protein [Patescibacteria group bacterium]
MNTKKSVKISVPADAPALIVQSLEGEIYLVPNGRPVEVSQYATDGMIHGLHVHGIVESLDQYSQSVVHELGNGRAVKIGQKEHSPEYYPSIRID